MNAPLPLKALRTSGMVLIVAAIASVFWFVTSSASIAGGPPQCTFCHKLTTTMTLACGDLEYRRHLDHGDTMGACGASPGARESKTPRDLGK